MKASPKNMLKFGKPAKGFKTLGFNLSLFKENFEKRNQIFLWSAMKRR